MKHSSLVCREWIKVRDVHPRIWKSVFSIHIWPPPSWIYMFRWTVQMLIAMPLTEEEAPLSVDSQLGFAHKLTHDSSCNPVPSLPQRSVTVGKTNNRRQAGKEWGSSTPFCPWGWLKGRPIPNVTFPQMLPFEKLKVIWRVIYYSPKLNTGNVLKWWLQRTSVEKTEFHLLGFSNTSC